MMKLFLLLSFQIIVVMSFIANNNLFHDNVFFSGFPVHLLIIVFLNIACLTILWKKNQIESKKLVKDTETTHEEQFRSLVSSVRSDRHDLNNHLTVISGLIQIGKIDIVNEYIKDLIGDIQINNHALRIQNPILASMLYSKMSDWHNESIRFEVKVEAEDLIDKFSSTDFIRLISNLLDNAFDATMEMPKESRKICFYMYEEEDHFLITVQNTSDLEKFDKSKFEMGNTTKQSDKGRGYGLGIIQELVKKYKANLHVGVHNQFVTFEIKFPK